MSTTRLPDRRTVDRLDIADTMCRYAEAMDHIGAPSRAPRRTGPGARARRRDQPWRFDR